MAVDVIVAFTAGAASLAALLAVTAERGRARLTPPVPVPPGLLVPGTRTEGISTPPMDSPIRRQIGLRFGEARVALDVHTSSVRLYSWANAALTFGQYVVGAVLASTFIQQTLSKDAIGSLGLVVLLSSAIQQRFRPDTAARAARRRVLEIRRVVRNAEDALVALDSEHTGAPSARDILASLSNGIVEVETSELSDIGHDTRAEPQNRATRAASQT